MKYFTFSLIGLLFVPFVSFAAPLTDSQRVSILQELAVLEAELQVLESQVAIPVATSTPQYEEGAIIPQPMATSSVAVDSKGSPLNETCKDVEGRNATPSCVVLGQGADGVTYLSDGTGWFGNHEVEAGG